jgi:ABC-type transport system involved in multi-copper enzyme maturation permease subunit
MNLLLSELNRFRSRRAVVLLLALAFVLSALITAATLWENRPYDERDREAARENAQFQIEECERNPRYFGLRNNPEGCADQILADVEQNPENFASRYPARFDDLAKDFPVSLMATLAFLALLAGTTFVGADLASGAMSTTLLFRPNRWQVWAAKIAATVLWTALVATVTLALCLGALAWTASSDPVTGMSGGDGKALVLRGARALLVVVGAAVLGAAVTTALRSTIATVGVLIGYLLLGETLLRAVFSDSAEPLLASTRVYAFVRPRVVLYSDYGMGGPESRTVLEMWPSGIYLGVIALLISAACAVVFSRRDVP